jgi:transmembrane 9 superfamily protein 2/4
MKPTSSPYALGILPFGAVFIELFFILTSIWMHTFYYIFGFLALVALILVITCAEVAIVLCCLQLCAEDYWWWSFFTSGALRCTSSSTPFYFAGWTSRRLDICTLATCS